jgi:IclR family transcriptional regulator, KDG regulon repressor
MQHDNSTHRSLEKALEILLSFAPHNTETSTQELSERLGFHRSTASRLLHVLERCGFLVQDPDTKKFLLGHAILDLGSALQQSINSNLTRIAVPFIEKLRNQIGETVVLEVAGPNYTVMAHIAEGPGPVKIKESVGARHWYNAAAGAKSILAFSAPEFQARILSQELSAFTPNTLTDPAVFKRKLKEIRRLGFSFDDEERNAGIRAFGCPVFNYEKKPVGALVIAGPVHRITWERRSELMPPLQTTAAEVSKRLYYRKTGSPRSKSTKKGGMK